MAGIFPGELLVIAEENVRSEAGQEWIKLHKYLMNYVKDRFSLRGFWGDRLEFPRYSRECD